ncbi:hypothetical protein [Sulfurisphaera tokodaii]|uniref:Uncharacterized protein n=1 Tax=Sulfurisphaera tokodaii TaxID=111955 RepID=A0A832TGM6_9CREN|nr:hypothetical protein [Sulfurisphaera tokodaii]HII73486.1 hypothetical protein [Sulfurisphaera tokodaii]
MNDAIIAGAKKLSELINGTVEAYVDEDGSYYLIGITDMDCRTNARIITQVLDEIYKHTDSINVTILLMEKNAYKSYMEKNKSALKRVL